MTATFYGAPRRKRAHETWDTSSITGSIHCGPGREAEMFGINLWIGGLVLGALSWTLVVLGVLALFHWLWP